MTVHGGSQGHRPQGPGPARERRLRSWLAATGVAMLLVVVFPVSVTTAGPSHAPLGVARGPEGIGPGPGSRAPVNESVQLSLPNPSSPGPNGTRMPLNGSAGDMLGVTVAVSLGTFSASWGLFQVHVPGFSVRFPTVGGPDPQFPLLVAPKNLTFSTNGTLRYSTTLPLTATAPFQSKLNASLSSNGYALVASLAWGSVALNVSWSYSLNTSTGAVRWASGPSVPQSIFPAQTFTLSYAGPTTVEQGTQFTACLAGPVTNRTFGLRGVNSSGGVFSNVSELITANSPGCLTLPVPSGTSVGNVTVQLWEYTNEPIRLRPLPATITAGTVGRMSGSVSPSNLSALLTIDGVPVVSTVNGSYSVGLPTGAHRWFFNATGYWPQASVFTLAVGTTYWLNITLLPRTQQPTGFGSPPLLNLTPAEAGALGAGILVLVALVVLILSRRRQTPPGPSPTSPAPDAPSAAAPPKGQK